ncbi:hypothetical protein RclHR1_32750003 [Rhizophagus clarus]|uniref:Uncharacterized protein n=1 Tax=Rhizophagus clarus TaxID=94130 RepID=A0A2Z6R960_9GLOM|nr:hypothetical protein RclHR1_32750003 [Rhizophagus clarus]
MWHNTLPKALRANYSRSTLTITYLMSSLDKAVIDDNEKVLILPIIALPIFTSTLMPYYFFTHTVCSKLEKRSAKTLIVTNGNGFCQEKIFDQTQLCMIKQIKYTVCKIISPVLADR